MTTIIIKRNVDANYDRLIARLDARSCFGRVNTVSEGEVEGGYLVVLRDVPGDVLAWVESKPKDFEVR